MYKLKDIISPDCPEMWQSKIACQKVQAEDIRIGASLDGITVFGFLLVTSGTLTIEYFGNRLELSQGDLGSYAPGIPTTMVSVSDDYEAYILNIDENSVYDSPSLQHFVRAAYFSAAEFGMPKLSLSGGQLMRLSMLMSMLRSHIMASAKYQEEAIMALCQLISLNILEIQDSQIGHHPATSRTEEIFTAFLRILPENYLKHRDLAFYADTLGITTTYLSRIVRQMSGRTVQDFIASAIAAEATIRLKTTSRSITQIAEDFGFSDQAAFTKFFTRLRGVSPREFRKSL